MNVGHATEIFCSPPSTGHESNNLSPYLREGVVKRMMVPVADTVEKGVKSVMFPTRDTAVRSLLILTAVVTLDVRKLLESYGTRKILTAHLFVKALGLPAFVPCRGVTQ